MFGVIPLVTHIKRYFFRKPAFFGNDKNAFYNCIMVFLALLGHFLAVILVTSTDALKIRFQFLIQV